MIPAHHPDDALLAGYGAMAGVLHGGAPVVAGEKWIATKWLRESVHV